MSTLRIGSWNMLSGKGRRPAHVVNTVASIMTAHRLDALLLQEVSPAYRVELQRRAPRSWRVFAAGTTAVLVPRHVRATTPERVKVTRHGWITVRGGRTKPKWAAAVVLDGWLRVASVHLPPSTWRGRRFSGPWRRQRAYRQHQRHLRRWINRRRGALLVAGDWNATPRHRGKFSPYWLARVTKARLVAPKLATHGRHRVIDFGLIRGARAAANVGSRYGSDHRLVVITVWRPVR